MSYVKKAPEALLAPAQQCLDPFPVNNGNGAVMNGLLQSREDKFVEDIVFSSLLASFSSGGRGNDLFDTTLLQSPNCASELKKLKRHKRRAKTVRSEAQHPAYKYPGLFQGYRNNLSENPLTEKRTSVSPNRNAKLVADRNAKNGSDDEDYSHSGGEGDQMDEDASDSASGAKTKKHVSSKAWAKMSVAERAYTERRDFFPATCEWWEERLKKPECFEPISLKKGKEQKRWSIGAEKDKDSFKQQEAKERAAHMHHAQLIKAGVITHVV